MAIGAMKMPPRVTKTPPNAALLPHFRRAAIAEVRSVAAWKRRERSG
jgi:hypothetical protein